jgi:hypothetical protein
MGQWENLFQGWQKVHSRTLHTHSCFGCTFETSKLKRGKRGGENGGNSQNGKATLGFGMTKRPHIIGFLLEK